VRSHEPSANRRAAVSDPASGGPLAMPFVLVYLARLLGEAA